MEDKNNMENGSVNPSELATLSLLSGGYGGYGIGVGGRGGYSGGSLYTGNNVLAAEAHADGTARGALGKHTLDMISNQGDRFEDAARAKDFSDLRMAISNTREILSREINDNRVEAIRVAGDNRVELTKSLSDIAKENAKCCCETQKLIIAENSKTRELMQTDAIRTAERELDACRSKNNSNEIAGAIATATANQTNVLAGIIANACNCDDHHGGRGRGRGVNVD